MRKIIINSILFVLFLAIFYLGGLFLMSNINYKGKPLVYITNDYYIWKGGGTFEKFKENDSLLNRDVIIVGSSRAYRHYNPAIFREKGISAWNLGSSAQPIENSYSIIKNVISKAKPKYILLDVARLGFEQSSIESSIDLLTNTSYNQLKKEVVQNGNDIRLYNTAVVSYFNRNLSSLYEDKEYKGAGFSTRPDSLGVNDKKRLSNITENSKNNKVIKDFEVLDSIIQYCLSSQQRLIIVHSPVSEFYSLSAQSKFVNSIQTRIGRRELSNMFYDFQSVDGINTKDHFYDDSHLNKAGVDIFNKALLEKLKFE